MDPRTNPYAPGAGTKPPALVGRDDQVAVTRCFLEETHVAGVQPVVAAGDDYRRTTDDGQSSFDCRRPFAISASLPSARAKTEPFG